MNTREWFRFSLRILGLVFFYQAVSGLPLSIGMMVGGGQSGLILVFQVVWHLALAFWLIRGAPLLMRLGFNE